MTRQYKAMQEELLGKINELQNTINSLKDELGQCRRKYSRGDGGRYRLVVGVC